MANKGIVVNDADSGESVACIDARQNDNDGNARIIQQVAEVSSPVVGIQSIQSGTPLRTLNFGTSGSEGTPGTGDSGKLNSSELESGITSNLLDVSDASVFVLYFAIDYFFFSGNTPCIQCVPLGFNDAGSEVAFCFPPAVIRVPCKKFYTEAEGDITGFAVDFELGPTDQSQLYQNQTDRKYISVPLVYPTYGLKNIGVSLMAHDSTMLIVDIFGYKLSGTAADAALSNTIHQSRMFTVSCLPGGGAP